MFINGESKETVDLGGGVKRKILAYENALMAVEVGFDDGAVGEPHAHPHVQVSYVLEGEFEVTVGENIGILKKGDSFSVPENVRHGVVCISKGVLLDFFTPMREDFIK